MTQTCCRTHERGQGLIELALVLPVLLSLIGAILDGGWALHQVSMVTAAAQAAERAVAIQDTGTAHCAGAPPRSYTGTAWTAAQTAAPGLTPAALTVEVGYVEPSCMGRMRTLTVSLTYRLTALTPWLGPLLNGRRIIGMASGVVEEVPPAWWVGGP
jgi:Flp pilus assembly protein TadG